MAIKIVATTTGMVLDGSTNSNTAGKPVDLWTYWHGAFQRWYSSKRSNGYYNIRTVNIDGSLGTSLDATNCSGAAGTNVVLSPWGGGGCQQTWYLQASY